MVRRWLALVLVASVAFIGASFAIAAWLSHPAVQPVSQPGGLVIVAMPRLSWADVSEVRTPVLWKLGQSGAVGGQATRAPSGPSCSVQSWLTFSAGSASDAGPHGAQCSADVVPRPNDDGSATFSSWAAWVRQSRASGAPADLGRVGSLMAAAGQCITTAGKDSGLGAVDRIGRIARPVQSVEGVNLETCPITLIGLEGLDDAYLGRLLMRLPSDTTLVVTGMADDGLPPTLHTVVMAGPGVPHGMLTSLSTRQAGVIQTTDLSALVLSRLGARAPVLLEGRVPVVRPVADATAPLTRVQGLTRALDVEYPFVPRFFTLFLGGTAVSVILGLIAWMVERRRQSIRGRPVLMSAPLRRWFAAVGAMCASMPVSTFLTGLVPWWRAGFPTMALCLTVFGTSLLLSALALLGPWRRNSAGPVAFLAAVTFFVIAQDVVHGSRLQFISLMGLQPVYGGRYYGQGNIAYAVYATAALVLAALIANVMIKAGQRRSAVTAVVLIGVLAVVIDGSSSWGADGGGPAAMMPAFAFLALKAAGRRLTGRRLVAIAGGTVAVVGGFALFDYLGPQAYRTHLGDFVAQLVNSSQWSGMGHIWTENWTMLTSGWLTMTVPVLMVVAAVVVLFPAWFGRPLARVVALQPFLRHGLIAVVVCWLLGFLFNDSGTGIPPTGALFLIPLLVVIAASPESFRATTQSVTESTTTPPAPVLDGPELAPAVLGAGA